MTVQEQFERLFVRYPILLPIREDVMQAYQILEKAYEDGGKLLVCGNGGSAADSDHIVGELMKGFYKLRPLEGEMKERMGELGGKLQGALPAIALTNHPALSTAFLNDVDPEMVFAQQVFGYGNPGDVFLGISTSGNAANVCNAAEVAGKLGLHVISLTGKSGGKLKKISEVSLVMPSDQTPDIQELHLPVYHTLCAMLEEHFF